MSTIDTFTEGQQRVEIGYTQSALNAEGTDFMSLGAWIVAPEELMDDSMVTLEMTFDYYTSTTTEVAKGNLLVQYATFKSELHDNFTLGCLSKVGGFGNEVANYWGPNTFDSASAAVDGFSVFEANADDMIMEPVEWFPEEFRRRRNLKRIPKKEHRALEHVQKHHRMLRHLTASKKLEEMTGAFRRALSANKTAAAPKMRKLRQKADKAMKAHMAAMKVKMTGLKKEEKKDMRAERKAAKLARISEHISGNGRKLAAQPNSFTKMGRKLAGGDYQGYENSDGNWQVDMDGEILVIDASTLEVSIYWDSEDTEPAYTMTVEEMAKEWYGFSESMGPINLGGVDVQFTWDKDNTVLSVRYEDPDRNPNLYFVLDTSTGEETGYMKSDDTLDLAAKLLTGEQLFKLGDAINKAIEKLEREATLCKDSVDTAGNPIC